MISLLRFHTFLLLILGFFLGNNVMYAGELAIIDQTETSWVIPNQAEFPVSSFIYYTTVSFCTKDQEKIVTPSWFPNVRIQNICLWHNHIAVLHHKKFRTSVFIILQSSLKHASYIHTEAKDEPPLA